MGLKTGKRSLRLAALVPASLLMLFVLLAPLGIVPAASAQTDTTGPASATSATNSVAPIGGGDSGSGGVETWVEYRKRVEATQRISALENGFAGEHVSLYNGATTFSVTDIDVPGNFALPVRLARRVAIELQPQDQIQPYDSLLRGVGNWQVDVPYMAATYPTSTGWNANRCSMGSVPPPTMGPGGVFLRAEVWPGITIHVPGRGDATALALDSQVPVPSNGVQYRLTTTERDVFDCIPMKSGLSGDGFRMTTTAGVRYYFDVGTTRTASKLVHSFQNSGQLPFQVYLERNRYYLLASKLEDRYGNTVQFQYDANGHPTRIWSSDGREITLAYTSGRLSSAASQGRTWQYQYNAAGDLTAVVLPDSSRWQYAYSGSLMPSPPPPYESLSLPWCRGTPAIIGDTYTLTATHPSGAVATFRFDNQRHRRSGVHASECIQVGDPTNPGYDLLVPYFYDVMSLTQKTLTGPGMPSATWNYDYSDYGGVFIGLWGTHTEPPNYPCTTCTQYKTVTVTNPDGTSKRYRFGIVYRLNDGRLLQTDTLPTGTNPTPIRTEVNQYMTDAAAARQSYFYEQYGQVLGGVADPLTARIRPVTQTVITQGGATFTTTTNTFDTYARASKKTESSSLGYSRIDQTTYFDNTSLWVLGQVATSTVAGVLAAQTTYTSKAQPLKSYRFGKLVSTNAWNLDGTLASVTDGNNHATTLSSWYRGVPRTITYADGAHQSAVVNGDGWITSVTDENGYVTSYGYDAMGRLASITYPTADDVAWNQTLLSFTKAGASEYGIPAGHWKQVVHTGNGYAVTYFDAMWRPLVTEHYDSGNKAATLSQIVQRYDALGRTIFASYPANNITSYATASTGTDTSYDALDRVIQVKQDSELGTLTTATTYQSGFETKVTDPLGHITVTSYQAFGEPTTESPDSVTAPAGELTVIVRDAFGKPSSITRTGTAQGSPQFTRDYVYDGNQQLCKRIDPESGATAFGYDNAGNLIWSAAGLDLPNTGSCDATAAAASSRRVNRTYDARNRLATLTFPDGYGDQTWTYTPDGLPAQVVTSETNRDVTNAYTYDKRRLLIRESLSQSNWYTWTISYGHDANAHLTSETLPEGIWTYAPDALGRPTQLALSGHGTYVSGVQYALDGTVKQYTRANGIVHTVTKNTRLLPSRIVDTGGGVTPIDQRYTYDKNANPTAITDYGNSAQNRTMTYDALDRLAGMNAASMGGQYNYSYDVLDNLRTLAHVGGSTSTYNYDSNRLTSINNTANGTTTLTWDVQGNLATRDGKQYLFSYGNRLWDVPATTSYRYDALGRRVETYDAALQSAALSLYGRDGRLVFRRASSAEAYEYHAFQYLGGQLAVVADYNHSDQSLIGVRYPHTDAQGTIVAYTNASRTILSRSVYDSWGGTQDHGNDDAPGYTGHMQDSLIGLTYMQQRYYDPALARFISVDPVGVDPGTGGNFNRYWYANDNPYRYTDPFGMCTGSHMSNKDGTCVSTGGNTTGSSGAMQGMRRQQAMASALAKYKPVINYGNINIDANVKEARKLGREHDVAGFVEKVGTGGKWDYKSAKEFQGFQNRPLLTEFGNFHLGLVAHAFGFTMGTTIAGAGIYQTFVQGHSPGYRLSGMFNFVVSANSMLTPNAVLFLGSDGAARMEAELGVGMRFGDYHEDTSAIISGYDYYSAHYGK